MDNVIISFATWQLQKKEYEVLFKKGVKLNEETLKWQQKWELPNLILLVEGFYFLWNDLLL